jgi:pimeloyl-ACP methyl ester carboxylesterase
MNNLSKIIVAICLSAITAFAATNEAQCHEKGDKFIFANGECINYAVSKGDTKGAINVVVHGTWEKGTNTLGRYWPYAETLMLETDITTIAIALPGYSESTTNKLKDLNHGSNSVYTKEYIDFIATLITKLKERFNADVANYIGHSAGASLGANMIVEHPGVVNTLTAAGGRYDLNKFEPSERKGLISIGEHLDKVGDTKILLVYGTEDKISPPKVTTDFYEKAKNAGIDVTIVEAKGAPHLDLDMTNAAVSGIYDLVVE